MINGRSSHKPLNHAPGAVAAAVTVSLSILSQAMAPERTWFGAARYDPFDRPLTARAEFTISLNDGTTALPGL
jgi:hypothetical protein